MLELRPNVDVRRKGRAAPDGAGDDRDANRILPARAYEGLAFQRLEDAAIWTRAWVGIGFTADVARVGDVLPFTVGQHGIHVERMPDDTLAGRFNKAQHGGCRTVPLQCQTGARTRCSFTACGYSYDRRPIAASDPERTRHLDQYLGLRPERLLRVPIRAWGPVLLTQLDPDPQASFDWPAPNHSERDLSFGTTIWHEVGANWKHAAIALASGDDGDARSSLLFPNVIVRAGAEEDCVLVLQPVALTRTLLRIRTIGGRVPDWVSRRAAEAERMQTRPAGRDATPADRPLRDALEAQVHDAIEALDREQRTDRLFKTNDTGDW